MKSLKSNEMSNLLKESLNSLSYLYMIVDAKDKFDIVTLNKQMALSFGKTKEELIGKNILHFLPSDVSKIRKKYANEVIKNKKPVLFEDERNDKCFLTHICPLNNDKDIVTHLLVFAEDITKRKEIVSKLKKREYELNDIGQKFQLITDYMTDLVFQITLTGKFTYVNPVSERYGYKQEEMIGKNFTKFVPKKELPKYFTQIKRMISGEKIDCFESLVIHKKGQLIPTEFSGQMIKVGKKRFINGIMRNVSERKQTEQTLKENEEKFRMLSNQSLMGIAIVQDDKFKYVNNALAQMGGYKVEEFYQGGISFFKKIVHPEDLPFVLDQLKKKLLGEKKVIPRYSFRILDKNKKERWIEIYSKTIEYEGRNADFVTFVDITEQMKATESLKSSEEKLQHLLISSPAAIYSAKPNGDYPATFISENIKKITGYNSKDFVNNPKFWIENIHPDDLPIVYKETAKLFNKEKHSYEYRFKCKNGRYIWIKDDMSLLYDKDGKPSEIIGYWADISEHMEFSHEIQRRKKYLQNVIDSASEIIFTIDQDFKIRTWNKTAEQITGHKNRQVVRKSIKQLDIFYNSSEIKEYIKNIQNKKTATLNEISIKTLYGITRTFSVSPSYITDESKNITEILFVCRDITTEKEIYGKIQSGNSYLIQESDNNTIIEIFNSLLESKKHGLYIGRISDKELQTSFKKIIPKIIKLTEEKDDHYPTSTNIEEIYKKIKDFIKNKKNTVILFDRIDYLIINNSFESVMKILYKINDLIQKHNSILLLRVNPSIINQNKITVLNEDFKKLPSQEFTDVQISQDLYEILTYIQNEAKNNITVNYGNIGKTFSISKVTAKRRLESLIDKGLIYSRKLGKTKILNITEKGKNLLKHRI